MKLVHVLMLSMALQSLVALAEQDKHDMEMHGADMNMDQMMDSMKGGSPPPDARDPDAYADGLELGHLPGMDMEIGRASCRERVCRYVSIPVVAVSIKKKKK